RRRHLRCLRPQGWRDHPRRDVPVVGVVLREKVIGSIPGAGDRRPLRQALRSILTTCCARRMPGATARRSLLLFALLVCGEASGPAPMFAHGMPVSLDFWGAFGRRTARCQRIIGSSAAACARQAWNARRECRLGTLRGIPCDQAATQAVIEAARVGAVNSVAVACTEQQALNLTFLGVFEAEQDVVRFCRELDAAAESAVFLPVGDDPAGLSPAARRCVGATALATTKLLHAAFNSHQRALDRIALRAFAPRDKHAMVAASLAAIGRDQAALEALMTASCSSETFARTYGRSPSEFLALIASRADCLAGRTYAQGGIICPQPHCGNGMQELPDESCDDGNRIDGDGCSAECSRE